MTSVEQLKGLLYSPKVACHFNSKKDKETHVILILRRPPINLNDLQCSLFLRRPINLNDQMYWGPPGFHGFANIDRNKGRMLEFSLRTHLRGYLSSVKDHFQSSKSKISKIHVFGH